jgi:hypothetical protein
MRNPKLHGESGLTVHMSAPALRQHAAVQWLKHSAKKGEAALQHQSVMETQVTAQVREGTSIILPNLSGGISI